MLYDNVWLAQVIRLINDGTIEKAEKGNVKVYKMKNVIRIDIKAPKE